MSRQLNNAGMAVLFILFFFSFPVSSQAAWEESDSIRVGVFPLGNFQGFDEEGDVFGYNIEYLEKIGKLRNWQYEYVHVKNWVEATEYLEQGKIDLLAPAQNSPLINERFSYAALPMGTEAAAVYTLDTREDIFYEDYEKMKGLKFGGAENSTFTKNFLHRAEEKGFQPNIQYYKNTTELFDALHSNEVDAIVTNIMFSDDGIKIIDRFSPLPVYYISSKDNSDLLDRLYDTMCAIELNEPNFKTELMGEYFPYYNNTEFTYSELKYIEKQKEISIGYWPIGRPISYIDEKTGDSLGISRDILDRISEVSGLKFKFVALPSSGIDIEYLKEHNIVAVSGVPTNEKNLGLGSLMLSAPYLKSENVIVGKENKVFNPKEAQRLAVLSPDSLTDELLKEYPEFKVMRFDSVGACFEAVRKGEADVLYHNRYVLDNYLAKPIYHNMKVLPMEATNNYLSVAVVRQSDSGVSDDTIQHDAYFLSILNKSIQRITNDEIEDIIIYSTLERPYEYTISDVLFQYRYLLIALFTILAICILGLIKIGRMREHENKVLSRAIGQANQANSAKSKFLSHMSHEIRTPLNAIVGMTSLAHKVEGNPEKTNQYLERITESSRLLMSIINDVLDMSAIESQKMKISMEPFDFKALLTSVSDTYYAQCRQKNIRFDMQLDQIKRETLIGDSLRANQVLQNLLSNAYKFTPSGGKITVTVTEKMADRANNQIFIRFKVADTGCGMSKEMQERLFGAFEQESASTALKHGGSGLGLAITKNLVDLMHGAIEVESEPMRGTAFIVDLPFGTTEELIPADVKILGYLRVMVIDDDSYMRTYISSVLTGLGVQFDVVESIETALPMLEKEAAGNNPYNICLVDWQMEVMDGIEVVKQIRSRISQDMLAVIISAYNMCEVDACAKEAGVDFCVSKPVFQSSIYNILASVHDKKQGTSLLEEEDYDFAGKRALLAEDYELNREVAVDLLELVNLEADCAEDGRVAVDMFLSSPAGTYDVILMDIQMPVMDGYEAMVAIRKSGHSQAASIPIFAMTANAFAEDVAKALSSGANGHIAKPIDAKAVYKLLNNCFMEGDPG